ncbi:MAG TPA: hypothetical protein P5218_06440, partial [Planctomycetota bacterium]|nr:hypothetical protein [Planctomycetota bacterium]
AATLDYPPLEWVGEDERASLRLAWQAAALDKLAAARLTAWVVGSNGYVTEAQWQRFEPYALLAAHTWGGEEVALVLRPDGHLDLNRLEDSQPSLLEVHLGQAFLEGLRAHCVDAEDRFVVAGIELAQSKLRGEPYAFERDEWWLGMQNWTGAEPGEEAYEWVDRKRRFLTGLARLGEAELGRLLWSLGTASEIPWKPEALAALGGSESARRDLMGWATDSLPVAEALQRAQSLSAERAGWILDNLILRISEASLGDLDPWLEETWPLGLRLSAFAALEEAALSPGRKQRLLNLLQDSQLELVRRSMRALAADALTESDWEAIERSFAVWDVDSQEVLLRELPAKNLSESLRIRCLTVLKANLERDGVWIDAVSLGDPSGAVWATLVQGLGEEFERSQAVWEKGEEVSTNRLAHWVTAMLRQDPERLVEVVGPLLVQRAQVLTQRAQLLTQGEGTRVYLEFSKEAIAALGASPAGRAWLRSHLDEAALWNSRLRIEVALQLAAHGDEELDDGFRVWLEDRERDDYAQLGGVLRERFLKALASRAGPLHRRIADEAQNTRAVTTVRRTAMALLIEHGQREPLFQILKREAAGEGVRLAAEALATAPDPSVSEALRARMDQAGRAIRLGQGNTELAEEMLVSLQVALVHSGGWEARDEEWALLGPSLQADAAVRARLQGHSDLERWPLELGLVGELAHEGQLVGLLERHSERIRILPGTVLAPFARAAWEGGDADGAWSLARMAEAATAGEASGREADRARSEVEWLRFQLAWEAQDWPRVSWYAWVLSTRYAEGGLARRQVESVLGTYDLRVGRNPLGRLQALWWQAQAYRVGDDDRALAGGLSAVARRLASGSRRALEEQARLEEWLRRN